MPARGLVSSTAGQYRRSKRANSDKSKKGVLSDKKVCDIPRRKKKFGLASFDNSEEVVSDIASIKQKLSCQASSDNSEEVSDVLKT